MKLAGIVLFTCVWCFVFAQEERDFYCEFIQKNEGWIPTKVVQLTDHKDNFGLTNFQLIGESNSITSTRDKGAKTDIWVMNLDDYSEGLFATADYSIASMQRVPNSSDYSFILKSADMDIIARYKNNKTSALLSAPEIVDFDWISATYIGVISKPKGEEKQCILYNVHDNTTKTLSINTGFSVKRINDKEVAFIDIFSGNYRYIKVYNITENRSRIVVKIPPSIKRFSSDGLNKFYITSNDEIKMFIRGEDADWKTYYSFNPYGISHINSVDYIKPQCFVIKTNE